MVFHSWPFGTPPGELPFSVVAKLIARTDMLLEREQMRPRTMTAARPDV